MVYWQTLLVDGVLLVITPSICHYFAVQNWFVIVLKLFIHKGHQCGYSQSDSHCSIVNDDKLVVIQGFARDND